MYRTVLSLILIIFTLVGCDNPEPVIEENFVFASASSIFVDENKICISGYEFDSNNKKYSTKYWIDDVSVDSVKFVDAINEGSMYQESVDKEHRTVYNYKNFAGETETYKFDMGTLVEGGKLFYYKDNNMIYMDTTALGNVSSVFMSKGVEYFAGYFGEIIQGEAGKSLYPITPFYWGSKSRPKTLQVPSGQFFRGISTIYVNDNSDIYVGGVMQSPMYWENSKAIVLNSLFGMVSQIIISNADVYAVGFYNKNNSNSTGMTACYWKNSELFKLEDNAQAEGIFIKGDDIYICGSVGRIPSEYKACYWKNGVRIDLPN